MNISHILHQILIGVNFHGDLHLDVRCCITESENWNFLKYGRIGKHPVQSLYIQVNEKFFELKGDI